MVKNKIAVIWLGNIWLPILYSFAKKWFDVVWYDILDKRIKELKNNYDSNLDIEIDININKNIIYTTDKSDLEWVDYFFVCVQTWVDIYKKPDITTILVVTKIISKIIKQGGFIIYESTLFPWAVDDYIIPEIRKYSKFEINKDFYVWYSPERVNPWDKNNKLNNINKIISCDNEKWVKLLKKIYSEIIYAELIIAPSVKHAEFAKIIENTQRYINIQFINEISIISNSYGISIYEVLELCKTKWNFLDFKPWIVSWACLSISPSYLEFSWKQKNINHDIINYSQKTQIHFKDFISDIIVKNLNKKFSKPKILFLWLTYKPNISIFKGNKYIYIYDKIIWNNIEVYLYDPFIDNENIDFISWLWFKKENILIDLNWAYDWICYFVDHEKFDSINLNNFLKTDWIFFDFNWKFSSKDYNNYLSL